MLSRFIYQNNKDKFFISLEQHGINILIHTFKGVDAIGFII